MFSDRGAASLSEKPDVIIASEKHLRNEQAGPVRSSER
jgi:hypothetical protein